MSKNYINYNPEVDDHIDEWLASSETERIAAVRAYHLSQQIPLPSPLLHAISHNVIETQLALGNKVVIDTLARLRSEGLTRHESVHAIGKVWFQHVEAAANGQYALDSNPNKHYLDQLKRLTAEQWRRSRRF